MFKQNKIEKLITKSNGIFSIFTKTQEDLRLVNNEIQAEINPREDEIQKITAELEKLKGIQTENEKLSAKIENFLTA